MSIHNVPHEDFRGKHCIVVADADERRYTDSSTVATVHHILASDALHVTLLPCRLDCATSKGTTTSKGAVGLNAAFEYSSSTAADKMLQRLSLPLNVEGVLAQQQQQQRATITKKFILVDNTFSSHPAVPALVHALHERGFTQEGDTLHGFGFAVLDSQIWPLRNNKKIFVLTDALQIDTQQPEDSDVAIDRVELFLQTLRGLLRRGATDLLIGSISSGRNATLEEKKEILGLKELLEPYKQGAARRIEILPLERVDGDAKLVDAAVKQLHGALSACPVHAFVNDQSEVSSPYGDLALKLLREQSVGVLRQAAMIGGLKIASALLQNPSEFGVDDPAMQKTLPRLMRHIYPLAQRRLLWLVDGGIVQSEAAAASSGYAAQQLLFHKAARFLHSYAAAGTITILPTTDIFAQAMIERGHSAAEKAAGCVAKTDGQGKHLPNLHELLCPCIVDEQEAMTNIFQKRELPPARSVRLLLGVASSISSSGGLEGLVAKLMASTDVVIDDVTLRGEQEQEQQQHEEGTCVASLIREEARQRGMLAVGEARLMMGEAVPAACLHAMEPSPVRKKNLPLPIFSPQQHQQQQQQKQQKQRPPTQGAAAAAAADEAAEKMGSASAALLQAPTFVVGSPLSSGALGAAQQQQRIERLESDEMRKPIQGGEGSLLGNCVSALSTTVLLHPLQLYLQPVPTSFSVSRFLLLRCLHSFVREVIFYAVGQRRVSGRAAVSGWTAGLVAGVASEPLRALAAGVPPLQAPAAAWLDPDIVARSAIMHLAPQCSYSLSQSLQGLLPVQQRNGCKPAASSTSLGLKLVMQSLVRTVLSVLLVKVEMRRQEYRGALASAPRLTTAGGVMQIAVLKQVLALLIENFVQKWFH